MPIQCLCGFTHSGEAASSAREAEATFVRSSCKAAYAKHAKLLAVSAKLADPESKPFEPPEKLVKY